MNLNQFHMKHGLFVILSIFISYNSIGQTKSPYQIFTSKGKKTSFQKTRKQALKNNIILFGEHHNNPIIHWLQYELTLDILDKNPITLGAEMFESDNQTALTSYINSQIDEKELDSTARLWSNYKTDYKPIVDLAKANTIDFIATNVPRRYAKLVFRNGFEILDSLPQKDKKWIAPLPIKYNKELPGYKAMLEMMGGRGENFPKAQAIKDATMAYFILSNYKDDSIFIHLNGAYHSDNYEGIYWYLDQHKPSLSIMTLTTVEQSQLKKLDQKNLGKADFIIVVDDNMTKTY